MVKKTAQQETEVREKMREGQGQVQIRHYLKPSEVKAKCRLCSQLTLPVGSSIGLHQHGQEDEIFIIQKGTGLVNDNGTSTLVEPQDVIITGNGSSHAIQNIGNTELVITAIIMQY